MSVRFNLLPPELRARQEQKHTQMVIKAGAIVVMAIFIGIFGILAAFTAVSHSQATDVREKRMVLESELQDYVPYVQMTDRLFKIDALLSKAVGTPPNWAQTLQDVSVYIPPNVWLTDLTASVSALPKPTDDADKGQVKPAPSTATKGDVLIHGLAYSAIDVAEWLKGAQKVPSLNNVRCQYANNENFNNQTVVRFEIKADMVVSPQTAPPSAKGGHE